MTDEEAEKWNSERLSAINSRIDAMSNDKARKYLKEVAAQIVLLSADLEIRDWPESLHLADVVEKRIGRNVQLKD